MFSVAHTVTRRDLVAVHVTRDRPCATPRNDLTWVLLSPAEAIAAILLISQAVHVYGAANFPRLLRVPYSRHLAPYSLLGAAVGPRVHGESLRHLWRLTFLIQQLGPIPCSRWFVPLVYSYLYALTFPAYRLRSQLIILLAVLASWLLATAILDHL